MTRRFRSRSGFTLGEVLVTVVILGIIGIAFTKMLATQSRFFAYTTSTRNARSVARNSMNLLLSDLRMVNTGQSAPGSVVTAANDGKNIKVRVPYWYGLVCQASAAQMTVSMLPVDSAAAAQAGFSGYAWRNRNASPPIFNYVTNAGAPAVGVAATCSGNLLGQAQIRTLTLNGRSSQIYALAPGNASARSGDPVFFYQEITYRFNTSSAFPGKIGLWRQIGNGTAEELIAPFDTSARFRYYQQLKPSSWKNDTSLTAPPAVLDSIRGFELVLNGLPPDYTGARSSSTVTSKMTTSVFFKNKRSF